MGLTMKRSERLQMVKKVVDDFERRKAEALAACERRVTESEKKLAELEEYLPAILTGEGPIFVELHTGLAEKTPMTDRGGVPFPQQVETMRSRLQA